MVKIMSDDNVKTQNVDKWKILFIGNDKSFHKSAELAIKKIKISGRKIKFLSAHTSEEARKAINDNDDIALIFIDMFMESNKSGFELVSFIRDERKNSLARIILRTVPPGAVPDNDFIMKYDITGHRMKTEFTSDYLFTAAVSGLRSYESLLKIQVYSNLLKSAISDQIESMENSEKKYRSLFEHSNDAIIIHQYEGKILDVNTQVCDMLGLSKDKILTMSYQDLHSEYGLEKTMKIIHDYGRDDEVRFETVLKRGNGTGIGVEINSAMIDLSTGVVRWIVRDISEQMNEKDTLRRNEEVLKKAEEAAHLGKWEWDLSDNSLSLSDEFRRICGMREDESIKDIDSFLSRYVHPDDKKIAGKASERLSPGSHLKQRIYRIVLPGDEVKWVVEMPSEVARLGSDGNPGVFTGAIQDITRMKQAEKVLEESERVQREYKGALGEAERALKEREKAFNENKDVLKEKEDALKESKEITKKREETLKEIEGAFNRNEELLKEREDALNKSRRAHKKSEEALKRREEVSETGSWEWNTTDDTIRLSDEMRRIYGIDEHELTGGLKALMAKYVHPDDRKAAGEASERRNELIQRSYRILRSDGKVRWIVELPGEKTKLESDSKPVTITGIVQDISDLMKVKEDLELHDKALEQSMEGIAISDAGGNLTYANSAWARMHGYETDEIAGMQADSFYTEDQLKGDVESLNALARKNGMAEGEAGHLRKDGSVFQTLMSSAVMKDESGVLHGMIYTARDISMKIKMEKEISRGEEKFSRVLDSVNEGYFEADLAGNMTFVSDRACSIFGYSREELIGMNNRKYTSGDTGKNLYQNFNRIYRDGKSIDNIESEITRKDGRKAMLKISAGILSDESSNPAGFYGTFQEVTEQKQLLDNLREKEGDLSRLFETMSEGVLRLSSDGIVLQANRSAENILGLKRSELEGKNFIRPDWELLQADGASMTGEDFPAIRAVTEKNALTNAEAGIKRPNEVVIWLSINAAPISDDSGVIGEVVLVFTDISKRVNAERIMYMSEVKYRSMLNNIDGLAFTIDYNGDILFVNSFSKKMFGYDPDEMIGNNFRQYIYADDVFDILEKIKEKNTGRDISPGLLNEKFSESQEFRMVSDEGNIVWIEARGRFIKDFNGELVCFRGIAQDITEQKLSGEKLSIAIQKADKAGKEALQSAHSISEFFGSMNNEIRAPMNAVIGFSELLDSSITDSRQRKYLELIKSSEKLLLTVINDIIDLSKIESGKMTLDKGVVNLQAMFEEIKQFFEMNAVGKDIEFLINIDSELPPSIVLDEFRTRQALLNLIENAAKFKVHGDIKLSASGKSGSKSRDIVDLVITIEVTDPGMHAEEKDGLLESFTQKDRGISDTSNEAGLRVTVSRKLFELMNGDISVKNGADGVSIYEVTLHDVMVSSIKGHKDAGEDASGTHIVSFEKGRVLIVDDIDSNRYMIREWLVRAGLDVAMAADVEETLLYAEEYQPNLILMDKRMRKMNAMEAMKKIKSNTKTREIPVISMTALQAEEEEEETGFNGNLSKPVDAGSLFDELSRYFNITSFVKTGKVVGRLVDFIPEDINDILSLSSALEQDMMPIWDDVKGVIEEEAVKSFSERLIQLGRLHQFKGMVRYAEELLDLVKDFDVLNIKSALRIFPGIVGEVKEAGSNIVDEEKETDRNPELGG